LIACLSPKIRKLYLALDTATFNRLGLFKKEEAFALGYTVENRIISFSSH
jgi:hypothetical protein